MFSIQNIKHQYQSQNVLTVENWQVLQGQQWLLKGNSGSGKTTLLHILAGLLTASEGNIEVLGKNLKPLSNQEKDKFRGKNIGFIFQKPHLIKTLNVIENLLLAQYMANVKQDKNKAVQIAEQLNIKHLVHKFPSELSQGEAQRVGIARAMLNDPKLILADEPTASLDDLNCKKVVELILAQAKQQNASLVISTHDSRLTNFFEHIYSL
ncbi:MAG: ATP-binding cassette domain-containing protein [Bacteroidetes bacterium]|nr:MAG: ATP-binding cassette domain-containing protein [Bacteroidota bacterium]